MITIIGFDLYKELARRARLLRTSTEILPDPAVDAEAAVLEAAVMLVRDGIEPPPGGTTDDAYACALEIVNRVKTNAPVGAKLRKYAAEVILSDITRTGRYLPPPFADKPAFTGVLPWRVLLKGSDQLLLVGLLSEEQTARDPNHVAFVLNGGLRTVLAAGILEGTITCDTPELRLWARQHRATEADVLWNESDDGLFAFVDRVIVSFSGDSSGWVKCASTAVVGLELGKLLPGRHGDLAGLYKY